MGRRALRKIDPTLDLSGHLKSFDDLSQPLDVDSLFRQPAPLEIEVGSGKGLFMAAASAANPQRNLLGIEISRKYARFAAARLAKAGCGNAVMLHGDGLRLFQDYLPDASLAAVHVYFPDPWWKKRHQRRRVMTDVFVRNVERVLGAGGVLHFWTDVEEYFHISLELIAASTGLHGPVAVAERPAEHAMDYHTHFERRMRLHGQTVYRAEFRKS